MVIIIICSYLSPVIMVHSSIGRDLNKENIEKTDCGGTFEL